MISRFTYRTAQWGLACGLLFAAVAGSGGYWAVSAALLLLHLLARVSPPPPRTRLALLLCTAALLPLCLEAAHLGAAAILGVLPVFPDIELTLRQLGPLAGPTPEHRTGTLFSMARLSSDLPYLPGRASTPVSRSVTVVALMIIALGAATGLAMLAAAGIVVLGSLVGGAAMIFRRLPAAFVETDRPRVRVVAGETLEVRVSVRSLTSLPCALSLRCPAPWTALAPETMRLEPRRPVPVHLTLTPPLAGPSRLPLEAVALDPWGLTATRQQVEAVDLHIIPRARYAFWLARRYLERTRRGGTVTVTAETSRRAVLRGGLDYRGARAYAPGDSLREIDWKHTAKLRNTVVKEFAGSGNTAGVFLVRLEAEDADAADVLASRIILTALTLAREGVPMVLAGYTQDKITAVTPLLASRDAVRRALNLADQIVRIAAVRRTLDAPKIGALRRMHRLLNGASAAGRLQEFIALEILALGEETKTHPAARALRQAAAQVRPPAAVLLLSVPSEPPGALDATMEQLRNRGYHAVSLWE